MTGKSWGDRARWYVNSSFFVCFGPEKSRWGVANYVYIHLTGQATIITGK